MSILTEFLTLIANSSLPLFAIPEVISLLNSTFPTGSAYELVVISHDKLLRTLVIAEYMAIAIIAKLHAPITYIIDELITTWSVSLNWLADA